LEASKAVSQGELALGTCFINMLKLKDGSCFIANPLWHCNDCHKGITTPLQSVLIRQHVLEQNNTKKTNRFYEQMLSSAIITNLKYNDKCIIEQTINATYRDLQMYVRDVNLPEAVASKYTRGQILRERAFVDMTAYILGMVTAHRYTILSNHVTNLCQTNEQTAAWGLHVANRDSYYRVMDKYEYRGKEQILLLHLPDDNWQLFTDYWQLFTSRKILLDKELVTASRKRFTETCRLAPIPELASSEWLERLVSPIGLDNNGNLFDLYSWSSTTVQA
jgi:transcriptional regulator NrdR family protein